LNRKKTAIRAGTCLLAMLLLSSICVAETVVKWNDWTNHNQGYVATWNSSQDPSQPLSSAKWYLDGQFMEENSTPAYVYEYYHTFNSSEIGFHNITCEVIPSTGSSMNLRFWIYIGTMFIVPNGTETVNVTSVSVITAPGEEFNLTTITEPGVAEQPKEWLLEASALDLLQPEDGGYNYANCQIVNSTNASATVYTYKFPANNTNCGTLLLGMSPLLATVDEAWNSLPCNLVNAEIKISPRYDINADFVVNIIDLVILRQHYGESTTEPYPRYDMNKDGIVNIMDLVTLKQHYGEQIETV